MPAGIVKGDINLDVAGVESLNKHQQCSVSHTALCCQIP